ncbi:MAG: DUF6134 family protein [Hyphomonas sp.]|uniref:DUF6134 family protein n=1 Tax=Hyphomonas sp. TaxID=87 RepID=UPI0035298712
MSLRAALVSLTAGWGLLTAAADVAPAPNEAGIARWQPQDGDEIRFNVFRQGQPFGSHVVTFDVAADGTLTARSDVKLKAGLGPLVLYHYKLSTTETWKDGQLVALDGTVNKDGRKAEVEARREAGALEVDGTAFEGEAPAGVVPSSHWNIAATRTDTLLSTESGELIPVTVREQGRETVVAGGQAVEATKYLLDSEIDVSLWYDDAGRWVKLSFEARGQQIDYELARLY